jgi:error-prone DNA polymerase
MSYIELHARSAFSFLEGASLPEELVAMCAALEMPAMAVLDRDGVYGAPRFHMAAQKAGIRAHLGVEITLRADSQRRHGDAENQFQVSSFQLPVARNSKLETRNSKLATGNCSRLPLLITSRTGYQNLCRLITRMKLRTPKHSKPGECATTPDELAQYSEGLICLTGGDDGPLAHALERGIEQARHSVERLVDIFGRENVYVELQRHFERSQEACNQAALEIARSLHLPVVATNGVEYAHPREREIMDAFTCIRNHCTLETAGRELARNSERHLKSAAHMAQLFADLPEAVANTKELSSRLAFTMKDLGYEFPRYPVPEGETMMSFLRKRTEEGARERYLRPDKAYLWQRAQQQIERELALIERLDLAGYFLIVWDIVRHCRENRILIQGRGSAANSAVCYSLGITAVDPVGMDLLFERFLSEQRGEWPDIDLDLPSGDQRERAIQYVYERYGKLGAAMTANVITYRGRSAAREMGKVLGFDPETLDRLSKVVGGFEYRDPKDTLDRQFHDAGFDLQHPRIRKFFELCLAVQDLPRHLGQHSGGMVICQGQLDSVVPLEPATMPGRVVVQWDKDDCTDMGIIKVDLLGLGMMAVIEDSLKLIREHHQEEVDLAHLPPDDPDVYAALQQADTVGMFQIESRAQMSCLPRLRPEKFYDIVVQVAIIRPGPIVGNMVHPYLKRRQGREPVTYPHPSLEPVLARTLGVPLFQEQLLRMAMSTAGFTGGEAEELRRAFGFKRSEARMKEVEVKLRHGMERNGIATEAQEQIIHSITSFALYGFPESHSASFALLAYASAYLKCRYLAAFTCAMLNNQPMGFYHASTLVKDAQRHGLKVRPIDVMRSDWACTIEPVSSFQFQVSRKSSLDSKLETRNSKLETEFALRLGLRYIKALREEAAHALVREREKRPFTSIDDLVRRVPELRKTELVMLAEAGALNSVSSFQFLVSSKTRNSKLETRNSKLPLHRRDALWQVERAVNPAGPLLDELHEPDVPPPLARMTHEERLVADFRRTGLTTGPHPMAYHRRSMDRLGVRRANELANLPNGKIVRVAGGVIARQRPGTAKGFVFLSLEDETGIANAIITPDLFDQHRLLITSEQFLLIKGVLQNLDNVISVKAENVEALNVTSAPTSSHDFH